MSCILQFIFLFMKSKCRIISVLISLEVHERGSQQGSAPALCLFKTQDAEHKANMLLTYKQVRQKKKKKHVEDSPDAPVGKNRHLMKMMRWAGVLSYLGSQGDLLKDQTRERVTSWPQKWAKYHQEQLLSPVNQLLLYSQHRFLLMPFSKVETCKSPVWLPLWHILQV